LRATPAEREVRQRAERVDEQRQAPEPLAPVKLSRLASLDIARRRELAESSTAASVPIAIRWRRERRPAKAASPIRAD
jgi:hypothetical protein